MEKNRAGSASLPFPVKGWNTRDAAAAMEPLYALILDNVFPRGNDGRLRRGCQIHASGLGGTIGSILEFPLANGSNQLIAAADGKVWNATTFGAAPTSLGTGFNSNRWEHSIYASTLILVNGVDQPQQYDGTTLSAAAYTGIADDAVLCDVVVFKERLYFLELDSTSFWYGSTGAVTGALTEFDVGDFLSLGGYLQAIASWTTNTGLGLQDLLVLVSSEGEILTYSGTDPATDFAMTGRYVVPKPHGRRCVKNLGADCFILHQEGVTALSQLIEGIVVAGGYTQFNDAIAPTFRTASQMYGDNTGWELQFVPELSWSLINVPTSSASSIQYVMNSRTGAWCRFTGMSATCWALLEGQPFFGAPDGNIYQADYGESDNGAVINWEVKWAFNYFGDFTRRKLFTLASAQIVGSQGIEFLFNIDTDFQQRTITDTVEVLEGGGSEWDEDDWDVADWADDTAFSGEWRGINGIGRAGALRMKGSFANVSMAISGAQIIYETAGYL